MPPLPLHPAPDQHRGTERRRHARTPAALPAKLQRQAADKGFEVVEVKLRLIERSMGPTTFWFLEAHLTGKGHTLFVQRRIESKFGESDLEARAAEGCEVVAAE